MFRITRSERVSNSAISKCTYPVSACRPFALRQLTPPPVPRAREPRILEAGLSALLLLPCERAGVLRAQTVDHSRRYKGLRRSSGPSSNVAFIEADDAALVCRNGVNLGFQARIQGAVGELP